jgi:hypothetical protein
MDDPRQEQFETHMHNLAVDIGPVLDKHFTTKKADQQIIFGISFVVTEYLLDKGFTAQQIELMMNWGRDAKIGDWNETRSK